MDSVPVQCNKSLNSPLPQKKKENEKKGKERRKQSKGQ